MPTIRPHVPISTRAWEQLLLGNLDCPSLEFPKVYTWTGFALILEGSNSPKIELRS